MTCDRGVSFEVLKSESSIFEKKKSLGREVCFFEFKNLCRCGRKCERSSCFKVDHNGIFVVKRTRISEVEKFRSLEIKKVEWYLGQNR